MSPVLDLPFTWQPDLAATMDIQIPALAWLPTQTGWRRVLYPGGDPVTVTVTEIDQALRFTFDDTPHDAAVRAALTAIFPRQIGALHLGDHPALTALNDHYRGVIVMAADPFEALVLTVLSQNRSGETVRAVYPGLTAAAGGTTADRLHTLTLADLTRLIRSAGPYKAPRLATTVSAIVEGGPGTFDKMIREAPTTQAHAYLEALPGVGHKTAACVLVFATDTRTTLPVDTHLFRVADRLGVASHNGHLTATNRDAIIAALLSHGADLAPAHFLFLLVGRTTCVAAGPACERCFLRPHCATAQLTGPPQ